MFHTTGKWANWELAKEIRVGDYGHVDRKTGAFEKYGNIYDENLIPNKTDEDNIVPGEPLNYWKVSTDTARECNFSAGPDINLAGTMGVALTGTWEFSGKRGAVLLMHLPQLYQIPNNKLLNRLIDVKELQGKYIVSDAYTCPASSLYLSGKSDKQVTFNLHADVDPSVAALAAGVPIGMGSGIKAGWSASNATGMHQSAGNAKSITGRYTPLFTLKKRRWLANWRGRPEEVIPEGGDRWEDIYLPWGPLDEDGNDALEGSGDDSEYSDIEDVPEETARNAARRQGLP
ncbi:hypothetical protein FIBSPDRAFT_847647 [Athelia psychrophila]|uniref:Uncharacterized protein n=1 Tax=Athelia psychrophila TaxID=1759441 RepID=A0A166WFA7_9AGAM|nr:hypothetical protein FIBSPDRAFT_847647 [Fibularhizoctonia sp. CBS 109695]